MSRVLLITARADLGGGPRHIELLLQQWGRRVDARLACPPDWPYWSRYRELTGSPVVEIPHRRFSLLALRRLQRYAQEHGIELVHAHGKGAGVYARLLGRLTGIPAILTPHGIHLPQGRVRRYLYRTYERLSARWLTRIVFVSNAERSLAASQHLWPQLRNVVIPNGVPEVSDVERERLRELGSCRLAGLRRPVAISVLRANYQKNPQALLRLARAIPDMEFVWIGATEASMRSYLGRALLPGNVHLYGECDLAMELMAAADVYVSTSRWEGLPLSALEAMALGMPVVLSDIAAHRELVVSGVTGRLLPEHDHDGAVAVLRQSSSSEPDQKTMGIRARQVHRENFTAARMADDLLTLYEEVIAEAGGGAAARKQRGRSPGLDNVTDTIRARAGTEER